MYLRLSPDFLPLMMLTIEFRKLLLFWCNLGRWGLIVAAIGPHQGTWYGLEQMESSVATVRKWMLGDGYRVHLG